MNHKLASICGCCRLLILQWESGVNSTTVGTVVHVATHPRKFIIAVHTTTCHSHWCGWDQLHFLSCFQPSDFTFNLSSVQLWSEMFRSEADEVKSYCLALSVMPSCCKNIQKYSVKVTIWVDCNRIFNPCWGRSLSDWFPVPQSSMRTWVTWPGSSWEK